MYLEVVVSDTNKFLQQMIKLTVAVLTRKAKIVTFHIHAVLCSITTYLELLKPLSCEIQNLLICVTFIESRVTVKFISVQIVANTNK